MCANDRSAVGVLDALRRAGVDVPGGVSITGYDDSVLAQLGHIDLTSVSQAPREQANRAVEAVVERLDGGRTEPVSSVLMPQLGCAGTTAAPTVLTVSRESTLGMLSDMTTSTVSTVDAGPQQVARRVLVNAPARDIFAIVSDPHRHPELDGSGTVRDIDVKGPHRLSVGDKFTVGMKQYGLPYKITSTATEV